MAELLAKREARRRKILENSERRLHKITGRNGLNEFEDNDTESENKDSIVTDKHVQQRQNECLQEIDMLYKQNDTHNMQNYDFLNSKSDLDISTTCNNALIGGKRGVIDVECIKAASLNNFFQSHISYVLMAVAVNILLMCKLNHLYEKVVGVPYLIMVVSLLCTSDRLQVSQNGSLLVAALLLCNVKPELTYRLKIIITFVVCVLHDIALYIFSFAIVHTGISYYSCSLYNI